VFLRIPFGGLGGKGETLYEMSVSSESLDDGGAGTGLDLGRCLVGASGYVGNPPGIEGAMSRVLLSMASALCV
jgi:hypothetical protein